MRKKRKEGKRGKSITPEKRERMVKILNTLKKKLEEIDKLREEIERETPRPISSEEAKAMLEEIKVPPLELIEAGKKKK